MKRFMTLEKIKKCTSKIIYQYTKNNEFENFVEIYIGSWEANKWLVEIEKQQPDINGLLFYYK